MEGLGNDNKKRGLAAPFRVFLRRWTDLITGPCPLAGYIADFYADSNTNIFQTLQGVIRLTLTFTLTFTDTSSLCVVCRFPASDLFDDSILKQQLQEIIGMVSVASAQLDHIGAGYP